MKARIKALISYSLNEVENMFRQGQISERDFTAYKRVWAWINFRAGGREGEAQEWVWANKGRAAYYAKINRTRVAFGFAPLKGTT